MSDFRLRVFEAVARHLSFTKAARELFVTQPAVTKPIHELEKHYGQRLLERRGNRVALTEAGWLLLCARAASIGPGAIGLTLTLFFIGAGLSAKTMRAVGARPYVLGVMLWVAISSVSLYVILHTVA